MDFSQFAAVAALVGGLLSFFSPCVLPLAPGYLCFLAGVSLREASETPASARRLLPVAAFFVLGFSTVFIALGASAAAIHPWLLAQSQWLATVAGAVIFLFGVYFMLPFSLPWLERGWQLTAPAGEGATRMPQIAVSYIAGLAFAFGWTPCIGPILAAILALAAADASLARGVGLLTIYSLGLGLPFLLAAALLPRFLNAAKRASRLLPALRIGTGVLLAATGLLILTGDLARLAWWTLSLFPALGNLG